MTFVQVGDVLASKYRVERVLGVGGMGMVVAATHLELEQRVALKFMLPHALASEQAVSRFLREARAAVRLRSEHVCRVLDVGKLESGVPYIVMEYMEGQDLAQLLEQRAPLPVAEAIELMLQACEGVAEAHAQQIIHRDLKPANLFVMSDSDGSPLVKVLDFGISKAPFAAATKTGDIMGSPSYMAPEQMASSKDVDARADLWALGVILFQALGGALPFEADTLPALCVKVMSAAPVDLRALRADVPAGLVDVVRRTLSKSPSERPADVAAFAAEIAPFGSPESLAAASRIARVLRRPAPKPAAARQTPAGGVAPTLAADAPDLASSALAAHGLAATVAPAVGRVSTLQHSAAEIAPRASGSPYKWIGLAAGAALIGVMVLLALRSGGNDTDATSTPIAPAASTAPTVVEPLDASISVTTSPPPTTPSTPAVAPAPVPVVEAPVTRDAAVGSADPQDPVTQRRTTR